MAVMADIPGRIAELEKTLTPVIEAIVAAVPQLRESYAEHVRENEGKTLSYIYLPDAVRILNEQLWARQLTMGAIQGLCATVESVLEKENPDIDTLIHAGISGAG